MDLQTVHHSLDHASGSEMPHEDGPRGMNSSQNAADLPSKIGIQNDNREEGDDDDDDEQVPASTRGAHLHAYVQMQTPSQNLESSLFCTSKVHPNLKTNLNISNLVW